MRHLYTTLGGRAKGAQAMSKVRPEDRSAWEGRGGKIRHDSKGRPVFVIRKQLGGRRCRATLAEHVLPHLDRVTDRGTKIRVLNAPCPRWPI